MKKFLLALGLWLATASAAWCQGTLPVALTQPMNANSQVLPGALLYTYVQGTVAQQQTTFVDSGLTIANPWPLQADQNGRIPMFYMASGSTHVRLTDATGLVQFDIPNMLVIGPSGGGGGGGSVDPTTILSSGDLKVKYGTGALSGFVRANGLTIGSAVSGATERANSDTQNLFIYLYGADPNLAVSGGRSGNALNDFNANKTITLPDWRGRAIMALADMGNSPTTVLTSTYFGTSPTVLGAQGGNQSVTLSLAQLPTGITSSGNINVSGTASNQSNNTIGLATSSSGGCSTLCGWNGPPSSGTVSSSGVNTLTSNNTSGAAHPTVMPAMLATVYLKL
jgi:hypothetical protein